MAELKIFTTDRNLNVPKSGKINTEIVYIDEKSGIMSCLRSLDCCWVSFIDSADEIPKEYFEQVFKAIESDRYDIVWGKQKYISNNSDVMRYCTQASPKGFNDQRITDYTFLIEGTFINLPAFREFLCGEGYGTASLTAFIINSQCKAYDTDRICCLSNAEYRIGNSYEGDYVYNHRIYSADYYIGIIADYSKILSDVRKRNGGIVPVIWQQHILFIVNYCILVNMDNKDKRLFGGDEAAELLRGFGTLMENVEDWLILSKSVYLLKDSDESLYRWFLLILKYHNTDLCYDFYKDGENINYGYRNKVLGRLSDVTVEIQSMDYNRGVLAISGTVSPIAFMNGNKVCLKVNDEEYDIKICERYSHTKAFGVSIYKRVSFDAAVKITGKSDLLLKFISYGEKSETALNIAYNSHFSRLTDRFKHSYWIMDRGIIAAAQKCGISVKHICRASAIFREVQLWLDMVATLDKKVIKYIPVRLMMHIHRAFCRKPIWLFMDKIYKAGDSSEYLYHYVKKNNKNINCKYVLNKECPDYKRMIDAGDKPIKQKSMAHRRAFLCADMIVASNSTVFAFNDMSVKNSAYIKDLLHSHIVCVQHGLSIQKIAIAQNRLRDNTRLYFCASRYELENLNRPVYDYAGRDVLKLTGVPRYDGLVNEDKRQILITPTWRMQAAVPVTKNESVARDYNPLFKESAYYKVYNSLINDERLIAAAKKYGYRILYVLHPIVSPQAEDFDRNEYVDIIPSTGDMSYEKVFRESSLMVTDYSGVQFDFAYMRKPLVYLHHEDIPQHYEEGTFHYDTMAFGEICRNNDELIELLVEYMQNDCVMKEKFRERADDFFEFSDRENCRRVYDVMLDYFRKLEGDSESR